MANKCFLYVIDENGNEKMYDTLHFGEARYLIPLFWILLFDKDDLKISSTTLGKIEYITSCVFRKDIKEAINNLKRRVKKLISFIPKRLQNEKTKFIKALNKLNEKYIEMDFGDILLEHNFNYVYNGILNLLDCLDNNSSTKDEISKALDCYLVKNVVGLKLNEKSYFTTCYIEDSVIYCLSGMYMC